MNIKIKNNRNGKVSNELVKKIVNFYFNELVGSARAKSIGSVTITFKKLQARRGGYARYSTLPHYLIVINSTVSAREVFRILAHECTHIKQYFTGELFYQFGYTRTGRRQTITNWKGRQYIRKAYRKQPWEIDARKGEKLACNILNKLDGTVTAEPVKKVEPVVLGNIITETIKAILNGGEIPNGELVRMVLNGDKSKQQTLKVLREVFALKQSNVIREVIKDSLVWVELV